MFTTNVAIASASLSSAMITASEFFNCDNAVVSDFFHSFKQFYFNQKKTESLATAAEAAAMVEKDKQQQQSIESK
ncbi:hypothetical protein [Paenibacillus psychroresistens]|uniref:hypothetical protein n=1 Tax=Paenibacillus psychroresistens TaxID=1778678 RepID=UPI001D03ABA5